MGIRLSSAILFALIALPTLTHGAAIKWSADNFAWKNGLILKQGVPFTGKVSGKYRGAIKNGKPVGLFRWYNERGQLKGRVNYNQSGKLHGTFETFHDDGRLHWRKSYRNGATLGKWHIYQKNGEWSVTEYIDGKRNGLSRSFWPNGELWSEERYTVVDGEEREHGVWKSYYSDGTLRTEDKWHQGCHELSISYHPNGKLKSKGRMDCVSRDGLWVFYNQNGTLKRKDTYKNGKVVD